VEGKLTAWRDELNRIIAVLDMNGRLCEDGSIAWSKEIWARVRHDLINLESEIGKAIADV